jgi:hypothetical protein
MAATDTVVGIVGAVLLAGIMVSVFVYEYNNAPDNVVDREQALIDAFRAAHPLLDPLEDIDGDGIPNYEDPDMDGNGAPDATQQGNLVRSWGFRGSSPAPPATAFTATYNMSLATGNMGLNAWLNWTPTIPLPNVPPIPNFTCLLRLGEEVIASCTAQATGRLSLSTPELAPGDYVFVVTLTSQVPAPATPYDVLAMADYGPASHVTVEPDPR